MSLESQGDWYDKDIFIGIRAVLFALQDIDVALQGKRKIGSITP